MCNHCFRPAGAMLILLAHTSYALNLASLCSLYSTIQWSIRLSGHHATDGERQLYQVAAVLLLAIQLERARRRQHPKALRNLPSKSAIFTFFSQLDRISERILEIIFAFLRSRRVRLSGRRKSFMLVRCVDLRSVLYWRNSPTLTMVAEGPPILLP